MWGARHVSWACAGQAARRRPANPTRTVLPPPHAGLRSPQHTLDRLLADALTRTLLLKFWNLKSLMGLRGGWGQIMHWHYANLEYSTGADIYQLSVKNWFPLPYSLRV